MKNLTVKELNILLEEKRMEYNKLRIEIKLGRSTASAQAKNLKVEIARIITEINIRRLAK